MDAWRKIRLGDACKMNVDSYSSKEKWDFINYLDTGNITDNKIDSIQYIDVRCEKLPSRARRKVRKDSIIYSTVRPNQRHFGIIKSQPEHFLVSTGFTVIDVDSNVLDADFLYYLLTQSALVEALHAIAEQSTSAYPSIKPSDIGNLEIEIPDLATQKKIADVLESLDRKITQNTEINENLTELLQTVYQERFGDASMVADKGILSDICSYSRDRVAVSELDVSTYFSTENMLPGKAGATEATSLPTSSQTTACHKGDTLISNIRPYFKKIVYCENDCGCSTDVLCFTPVLPKYSAYLFSTLYNDKFFAFMVAGSKGTKMPRGDKQQIMSYPVVIPSDDELNEFNAFALPILAQLHSNKAENKSLSVTRDTLLPKLVSGEINVSGVQL